jgi:hypothetical protein
MAIVVADGEVATGDTIYARLPNGHHEPLKPV